MVECQPAVLAEVPKVGRYVFFSVVPMPVDVVRAALTKLVLLADGLTDALFGILRPITGACFGCSSVRHDRLDGWQVGL